MIPHIDLFSYLMGAGMSYVTVILGVVLVLWLFKSERGGTP